MPLTESKTLRTMRNWELRRETLSDRSRVFDLVDMDSGCTLHCLSYEDAVELLGQIERRTS